MLRLFETYVLSPFCSSHDQTAFTKQEARHVDQISKNPRIDVERVRKAKYLHEFDRYMDLPTLLISASL